MRKARAMLARVAGLFRRQRGECELEAELESHLVLHIEENLRAGMTAAEARRQALIKLGGLEQAKELYRERRGIPFLETIWQDVRYGARMLRKSPAFTIVAVLTIALGIGANTAIFSVVDGVLLAPLPYRQPNRLVVIWEKEVGRGVDAWDSYPNFLDWQREAHSLERMAAFVSRGYNLTSPGAPEHVEGREATSGFFATLGEKLAFGREFTPTEDRPGGAPVAIISDHLWKGRFARSPTALGQSVSLNGVDYTVVGVLAPGFHFLGRADVYTPLGQDNSPDTAVRGGHPGVLAIARLRPSVGLPGAQAEMNTIQQNLSRLYPNSDQGLVPDLAPLKEEIIRNVTGTLLLLFGAVCLVLLIACANVASLQLERGAARRQEFAIRSALGASRARVARQLLTEGVILALAGGALGLAMAGWGVRLLLAVVPGGLPRSEEIGLHVPVLLFALGVSLAVGILFGLAPALRSSKVDIEASLRDWGRGSTKPRHCAQTSLVIMQMALTLVLLTGAGLLFRTVRHMWGTKTGFDDQDLITFKVELAPSLRSSPANIRTAYRELLDGVRNIPGVQAADITTSVPLNDEQATIPFWIDSHRPAAVQDAPRTLWFLTGPDYLRTMGIPLLRGRFLTSEDTVRSPCVVAIDSAFAHEYFPGKDPLGHTVTIGFQPDQSVGPCRIIGVVGHVRDWGLGRTDALPHSESYYALSQDPDKWVPVNFPAATLVVRTRLCSSTLPAIRKAVQGTGGGNAIYDVQTMQDIVSGSMSPQRFPMALLAMFAGLALTLASVGVYGLISYSVVQRVHEMGLRMALGAQREDVLRMVLADGAKVAIAGVAIGLVASLGLARLLSAMLFGVSPHDPPTLVVVSGLLVLVALVASYVPARRAMRVDPMTALRHE
ncbi:MAG: ABC transporter permease [Acidobacteriota bacterium]|nr:ABC transporter permease [Acidobacteriota bacterium]